MFSRSLWFIPGLLSFLLFMTGDRPLGAQATASGLVVEVQFGTTSAAELIRAPEAGSPLHDPYWIHLTQPAGDPNPTVATIVSPVVLPPLQPIPSLPNPEMSLPIWSTPGQTGPASIGGGAMSEVLQTGFIVLGWKHWQESPTVVRSGQRFTIRAVGRWSTHEDQNWCGPEGYGEPQHLPGRPGHPPMAVSFSRPGELIGRIGNGPGFRVGAGGTFTADRDGGLWFTINDTPDGATAPNGACAYCGVASGHCANNRGQVTVTVSLPR